MNQDKNNFPKESSNRLVLFADLRNSTDILLNFEKRIYKKIVGNSETGFEYGEFIHDLHETSYRELYCVAKGLIPSPLGRFIAFKDTPLLAAG